MNCNDKNIARVIYRLLSIKGIGNVQANRLLAHLNASGKDAEWLEANIPLLLNADELIQWKQTEDFNISDSDLLGFIPIFDTEKYPYRLKETLKWNSPVLLSTIGNQNLLKNKCVGFSGSRHVSDKGLWITEDCAGQLVAGGNVCVVSGYANGVDLVAHKTALKNGGSTIIVLPEGIDGFRVRSELKSVWDWNRVLVVSEFMPNEKWMVSRAMKRNQTIIGLSDTMLVIEAGETGGSLDAGMKTISYGKSLFVPYYASVPQSALGNNLLIRHGANSLRRSRLSNCTNLDNVWMSMSVAKKEQSLFMD